MIMIGRGMRHKYGANPGLYARVARSLRSFMLVAMLLGAGSFIILTYLIDRCLHPAGMDRVEKKNPIA
ncbi:MAG: hypothetical protein C4529_04720 [Deltaproteobacteria bacterium]|nr:MAG: hypothetical protein C4529_04720 [Deltaproteobacteria bacterium]